ncbi:MAG: hypothetical protein FD126_456 [Elusimicrobia bacterium]|nr:MAG: hypothetical protein FD126_456 [Elusimicrobiota bacterium]
MLRVTRLFYYPVKSLGGVACDRLELSRRGPKWDREWMVVGPDGAFLSQRALPRMARIQPSLEPDSLRLSAGAASISVPLRSAGPRRQVVVWDDPCQALDEGDAAAAWLSDFLGTACRLVRIAPDFKREIPYPDRFRPNVVVAGAPAWAEDGWKSLRGGGALLHAAKACSRCAITTLDPVTGEGGPEPLKTLASFRRGEDGGVNFGVYCVPEGDAALSVGETLTA